ncbi:hypothetical protein TH25_09350 [Thalassospira profundimaris]|uniref:Uncharacterized protein n=1 Tax=Thalassospira profundimaris TaxID=502049 RepID=A0A367XC76_9PROT|nr:hypothetical protein TH25_09350 [Thalassospira profundimaris]
MLFAPVIVPKSVSNEVPFKKGMVNNTCRMSTETIMTLIRGGPFAEKRCRDLFMAMPSDRKDNIFSMDGPQNRIGKR